MLTLEAFKRCQKRKEWPKQVRSLVNRYKELRATGRVPSRPLVLRPGETIVDWRLYLQALDQDIEAGPDGARAERAIEDLEALLTSKGRSGRKAQGGSSSG